MESNFIDQIQDFLSLDMTEREARIYLTLISKQGFTATELQQSMHLPSSKIYDVLKRMVSKGLCTERFVEGVKYYEAVNPEIAFKRVLTAQELELEKRTRVVKNLISSLAPVFNENRDLVNPLEFIEILKDRRLIVQRYNNYMSLSKNECLGFNKGPYAANTSEQIEEEMDAEGDFLKRGGRVRSLYQAKELRELDTLMYIARESEKKGEELRVVESLPIKMFVFDENYVMLPLQVPVINPNTFMMICVEHPQLALACITLFNFIWETGISFSDFLEKNVIESEKVSN